MAEGAASAPGRMEGWRQRASQLPRELEGGMPLSERVTDGETAAGQGGLRRLHGLQQGIALLLNGKETDWDEGSCNWMGFRIPPLRRESVRD